MLRVNNSLRMASAVAAALAAPILFARPVHSQGAVTTPEPALSPKEFRPFVLKSAEQLTRDTKRYVFSLPDEQSDLGLSVASCLVIKANVNGKDVVRPYTPTSTVSQRGEMELIVKTYPEGNVSKALWELKPGESIEMKGPFPKLAYKANDYDAIGMIAGGTGITPMYQVLLEILNNPRDKTEVRLLYASRSPEDIILRKELDALAAVYPNFKVHYVVNDAGADWKYSKGYITKELIAAHLPPASEEAGKIKIFVCGPPPFMKALSGEKKSPTEQGELVGALKDLAYSTDQVFKF